MLNYAPSRPTFHHRISHYGKQNDGCADIKARGHVFRFSKDEIGGEDAVNGFEIDGKDDLIGGEFLHETHRCRESISGADDAQGEQAEDVNGGEGKGAVGEFAAEEEEERDGKKAAQHFVEGGYFGFVVGCELFVEHTENTCKQSRQEGKHNAGKVARFEAKDDINAQNDDQTHDDFEEGYAFSGH